MSGPDRLTVLRICSVFEPPGGVPAGSGARFDPIGGMQNHTGQLTRALDARGITQSVVTSGPPGAPRRQRSGARATIHRHGLGFRALRQGYAVPAALSVLRLAPHADVVHAHLGEDLALVPLALAAARRARSPLVLTIHNSNRHTLTGGDVRSLVLRHLGGALELGGARRADAAITLTARTRRLLAADGVSPARLHVIPSGVDPAEFSGPWADPWPAESARRVVFAGRLARQKGVDVLVEAAARLRTRNVRVVLVGDGPEREALERRVRELELKDRVRFVGFVDHDQIPATLAHADLLVLPSIYEELGSVLVEAMQVGVPIVASDTGGIPDAVGDAAVLVAPGDPAALAAAIDSVLDDPSRATQLSVAARRRAASFDWHGLASRVLGVYREALGLGAATTLPVVALTPPDPAAIPAGPDL